MKRSVGEICFDLSNIIFLLLFSLSVIIPMIHIVAGSLSDTIPLMKGEVRLWPIGFNLDNYRQVMDDDVFWRAFIVTVIVVVVGTTINMILTLLTAYPLSKAYLVGKKAIMLYIIFTLIFSAPLIPTYLLIKSLLMLNTIWALIIPSALSAFNLILCMTFFKSLPEELFEAARIDGLSEYGSLFRIALPISMPIVMTLLLFYAVGHWNAYSPGLYFITDRDLRPLQVYLYTLISEGDIQGVAGGMMDQLNISPDGLKRAIVVVATVPILLIYPFIQKHFIKGALLGSVKQ